MNGVPEVAACCSTYSCMGRSAASTRSSGSMNVIANTDPCASAATWRRVASVASRVRYMLTPVDETTAARHGVEAVGCQRFRP